MLKLKPKIKTKIILLLLFAFKFSFASAFYSLNVEIKENKIIGNAVIKTNENINIDTTGLNVLEKIKKNNIIEISYEKSFKLTKEIFLEDFYPRINKLAVYSFKVRLPAKYIPISQAEEIKKKDNWYFFKFPYPLENLVLVARKDYKLQVFEKNGIKIYGYFYKNGEKKLLEEVSNYIRDYENLFGKFPYKRFAVVETSYPYGFSFPTFTTINSYIINKPYIISQSLAHEILHQWFGCSVYVDYKKGNWSEGLVSFYSNYRLAKDKKVYRKLAVEKYEAFYEKDEPLSSFLYKKDQKAEALGYGKGMFVFYMLSNLIGKGNLNKALKDFYQKNKFKKASWEDIKISVNKYSLENLDCFFKQWIYKAYVPDFSLKVLNTKYNKDHFEITLNISQKENFKVNIPVYIKTPFGFEKRVLKISKKKQVVKIKTKNRPLNIYLDPYYDVFRRLTDSEYDPLIYNFLSKRDLSVNPQNIKNIENKNVVFYSINNKLLKKLTGVKNFPKYPFVMTFKNPLGNKKTITLINNFPERLLKHYGNYSDLIFKNGKFIKSQKIGFFKSKIRVFSNDYVSVKNGALDFDDLISQIKHRKAIFIGENHPSFSNHISQLEIIKAVYKHNKNIVIGMEMFQKPFQKYLDEFINGKIDELTFLLKTQYYKRWGYDYYLYRPILLFAKKNKIRIIALNIPAEIIEKVSQKGIGSLTEKEKKQLPEIDFSDIKYKNFLKSIFNMHSSGKKFVYFYESQLIWDETMADTASKYAKDKTVIVLAGNGHLRYRYGIPSRFERRTKIKPVVVLNDDEIKPDIADFVISNDRINYKESPKLGVYLKEAKEGLKVKKVIKDSLAEKTGIKKDDLIVAYNNYKTDKVWKLKTFLTFLNQGDKLKIKRKDKILVLNIRY